MHFNILKKEEFVLNGFPLWSGSAQTGKIQDIIKPKPQGANISHKRKARKKIHSLRVQDSLH